MYRMVTLTLREKSQSVSVTILYIASIYLLLRPEVKAYFKKKHTPEREEKLSKEEHQELIEEECEKLTKEEKHLKEEYKQLMEED